MNSLDNLSEYADPHLYDAENSEFEPDGPFFLSLAKQVGGSVLELGCGTGRVTVPLAREGVTITGLDVVPGMVALAREKAEGLPAEWVVEDARSYQLGRTFRLIFETGSVFHHMLTRADQEAYLKCVREHLDADGIFVISMFFPKPFHFAGSEEETEWFTTTHPAGYEIKVSGTDSYDALRQVKTETAYRRWTDAEGKQITRVAPLSLRYVFPQEMEALLHYNHFEVVEQYGDFDKSTVSNDSKQIIYICQKRIL